MYPSMSQLGGCPPQSSGSGSYYPTVGQVPQGRPLANINGPSAYSAAAAPAASGSPTQNFPLLRVQVAEQYRTLPPVLITPSLADQVPRQQFAFDFELERSLVAADARGAGSEAAECSDAASSSLEAVEDPWAPALAQAQERGFSREEAAMALAVLGSAAPQDKVAGWCESYRALRAMGFAPEVAGGALTLHSDSLEDATEACLAAQ
ncbi:hypothetical protein WJX81_000405 [Elliptochloris bilobata]|uniref:UBA domain-containing protein n=1 Tax=Elliptochloris bilobata TaxID=381761 RepID=A0AAW1R2B5_9CHLO